MMRKTYVIVDQQSDRPLQPIPRDGFKEYDQKVLLFYSLKEAIDAAEKYVNDRPSRTLGIYQLIGETSCYVIPATTKIVE